MDRIAKLKEFLEANPDDSFVQHALALEYVKVGDDGDAKRLFENILNKDENYIGSYYHLGKLLERNDERESAIKWYELGMLKAKENGDMHAYNELLAALEDLVE
jgi:Tfp pilus assembly protein PilF